MVKLRFLPPMVNVADLDPIRKLKEGFKRVTVKGESMNPLILKALGYNKTPDAVEGFSYGPDRPHVLGLVPNV